eukprot:g28836.t1
MEKFQSVSSVSGGTWGTSIYMFGATFKGSPVSNTELLGTPLNPPDCTLARLQEAVPAIASGIVEGDSDKILAELGVEFLGREWEARLGDRQFNLLV